MYDDLRKISDQPDEQEIADIDEYEEYVVEEKMFGLTALQRLILAVLLLAAVVMMAAMVLLITERIWLFG